MATVIYTHSLPAEAAVLWSGGMLLRASSIDLQTVVTAIIAGVIVGGLMYWLFDKFRPRP